MSTDRIEHRDTLQGFAFAASAYLMWGVLPLYFKAMAHLPTWEIVAHRILWSIPVVGLAVWWQARGTALRAAVMSPRTIAMAVLLAALLSFNWGVYIWAVNTGRTLETALGYYVNPVFSMALASVLLGERLTTLQRVAASLAATAVGVLTFEAEGLPFVALVLCGTWGFYAYFKRTLPIGPIEGFFLEVLVMAPLALAMLVLIGGRSPAELAQTPVDAALFACSGIATAIPLLCYAIGAKQLRLTTIAIMQYISPSLLFVMAVFVFREPFSTMKLIAFALIWGALVLYTIAQIRR